MHSRARDQAVIAGHYDLPAAFYQLILDPSMAYSCGYWAPGSNLAGGALAFEEGRMGVDQILAARSAPARSAPARSTR